MTDSALPNNRLLTASDFFSHARDRLTFDVPAGFALFAGRSLEQDVVAGLRIKGRIEINQVDALVAQQSHHGGKRNPYFVSGQPLSFAVKNALSPRTTAICL
jgi:hypothetical protein